MGRKEIGVDGITGTPWFHDLERNVSVELTRREALSMAVLLEENYKRELRWWFLKDLPFVRKYFERRRDAAAEAWVTAMRISEQAHKRPLPGKKRRKKI